MQHILKGQNTEEYRELYRIPKIRSQENSDCNIIVPN